MKLTAFEIADRLGLRRPMRNMTVRAIVTDSRLACEGCLFAALAGERVDGHDFIRTLDKQFNNILFLIERAVPTEHTQLVSDNVLRALADIAALHLEQMPAKRVAVTGSVGKTTTKEMLATTLSVLGAVQKTQGNRNNELGMPLTAFTVSEEHTTAVFEMGMRGRGQIEYLARRVRPHIGIVTNIGSAHMELLGSRENICKAKMELAKFVAKDGVLLLNGDEPLLRQAALKENCKVRFFGIDTPADYTASDIVMGENTVDFTLRAPSGSFAVTLPVGGRHMVYNALAAFAAAELLGGAPEKIIGALAAYSDGGLRQNIYKDGGLTLFDDTYNASPESVKAALSVLSGFSGRKVAVLADMLELGSAAQRAHIQMGTECKDAGVALVIALGAYAPLVADGFGKNCIVCADSTQALAALLQNVKEGDTLLFKGSHAMECDKLLQDFIKRWKSK